jgi:hypothetical protein
MSRHVAHVEARGLPTPARIRRQRLILSALDERMRALPRSAGGAPPRRLRPVASFGFSTKTRPEDAVARLVAALDDIDPAWRSLVRVWDGVRGGIDTAVRG